MILESIVTTVDQDGLVNVAPMGPIVDGPMLTEFTLRPYHSSTTCKNLLSSRQATIHVTDDAGLFARSAVSRVRSDDLVSSMADSVGPGYWRLKNCHRWFAVRVNDVTGGDPLYQMSTAVLAQGVDRPFFGFNRAKHAIIEASILATRTHLLPPEKILADLDGLRVAVEKTAGREDRETFDWLCDRVRAKMKS